MITEEFKKEFIEALKTERHKKLCLESLSYFVRHFWDEIVPNKLIWNWHMDALCDEIQTADERVFKRLPKEKDIIINIPPGTSKTKIVSVMSTAWEFARMPEIKVFVGSFSDSAVSGIADEIRLLMRSERYRTYFPETDIRRERDSLHNFKTAANGEFYAFTVGGTITSKHADILKIDDPLNPKQSVSVAGLKSTNDFFDKTLPTRKVDKLVTPTYLIMQRLSVKDPTGHLLEKKGDDIHHICLPGTLSNNVKPVKYREMYINGYLDPERLSEKALADLRKDLGSSGYAGQIEQTPAPEGGTIWQKWFIEVPDDHFPPIDIAEQVWTDWDLAYTKEDKNSASAYITTGMIAGNVYIFDFDWQWFEFPQMIRWMKNTRGPHYIENKASGKSARQTLKQNGVIAIEVKVSSDKVARAKSATPIAEAGFVYIKKSMADRLYNDPKQGILFFPNGEHNDVSDTLSQALVRRSHKGKVHVADNAAALREMDAEAGEESRENKLDWL